MTKEEFIQQAVLAQMSSALFFHGIEDLNNVIIRNAKSMADACEKEHLFDQESSHDILADIRNHLTDET